MHMTNQTQNLRIAHVELTADIVAAYVSNNSVPVGTLADLLASVHAAISGIASGGSNASETNKILKPTPAQIKKSITPDGLISFEDGKSYKTLRRHLTIRGLTAEGYRSKYALPDNYPMTSANYSAARSAMAKEFGLGRPRIDMSQSRAVVPEETIVDKTELAPEKPEKALRPRKPTASA